MKRAVTIEELAGQAEVDASHLARIERGTVNSSVDVLERVAAALRVPLSEFFAEIPAGMPAPRPLRAGRRPARES